MTSYYDQVSSLNPKIWFRFNETAGTPSNSGSLTTSITKITNTFKDINDNYSAYNPPLLGQDTSVDGKSIYFDENQGYGFGAFPAFSVFDDKSFSIELWFKHDTVLSTNDQYLYRFIAPFQTSYGAPSFEAKMYGSSETASIRGKLYFRFPTGSNSAVGFNTPLAYNDNKWHHVVFTYNTTSRKIYIDGGLIDSATITTPTTLGIDAFSPNLNDYGIDINKFIGGLHQYAYINNNFDTSKIWTYFGFRGNIDEFALYDYELTAAQVNANYVAGSAVYVNDIPGTATALAVHPTITTTAELTAAPMTADATGAGHAASTVEFATLLDPYMSGLTLQVWYKFNILNTIKNYGTGLQSAFILTGGPINNVTGGIQGSGEFQLNNGETITSQSFGGTIPNLYNYENDYINDEDFTIGFWTRKQDKELVKFVNFFKVGGSDKVTFSWNTDGGITFLITANNSDYSVASTTDITDGEWHFVAGRLTGSTMELFIDGTSIGTATMNHTIYTDRFQFLGTDSTDRLSISHFFISTAANVTSTEISNMWDYGTPTSVQATAYMPEASAKFNSAFNDYIQSKSPIFDFRMDETSGLPVNYGSQSLVLSSLIDPVGYSQGVSALNNRTFNFTAPNQALSGIYDLPAGTLSTNDIATYGVLFKLDNKTATHDLGGLGGANTASSSGNGFALQILTSTGYIRVRSGNGNNTVTTYDGNVDYADDKWHLAVAVQEANSLKVYVDGKLHINQTRSTAFTDTGAFTVARIPGGTNPSTLSINKRIDETFALDTALTEQEVFEAWQALRLEMDTTATAEAIQPTTILGTGTIYNANVSTSSSEFVMPFISGEIALQPDHLEAHSEFIMPNYGTTVVIDSNYGHTSATANAEFHMPAWSIGDGHTAVHFEVSAEMVHPTSISGGQISVSSCVAGPAIFVEPGIVTVKGARVFADPALATAIIPLPPAYVQLSDDKWFATLLEGHADKAIEPIQATLGNLPNQSSTDIIDGGFLTFFNEFNSDLTTTTQINSIQSEIPAYYFSREEEIKYDENGVLIPLDTSKDVSPARAQRGTNLTTPRMGVGYFDDYERKAVRIENIEFPFPGTSPQFSDRFYNLEFSIKTTKKDQVLAYGYKTQTYGYGRKMGVVGLSDGKIYLTEDASQRYSSGLRNLWSLSAPHPKNFVNRAQYLLSKTNVADGNWHHVIIQYGYDDRRTQIWIDGKLDRQIGALSDSGAFYSSIPGLDGTNTVRPYILGFNSNDPLLYSDFETSGWNFYPGRFLTSQQILINYLAYLKYEPVKAEPMIGRLIIGQDNIARGNRSRMLLLYWWRNPIGANQFVNTIYNPLTTGYDGNNSPFSPEDLIDDPKKPPQDWYGWDVFPVGVVKPSGTDIAKPDNIGNGVYLDIENGRTRMLDLEKDLDLSQFDMIMFANYPTTSAQLDEFIREEFVDKYFGVTEADLYQDFLKSLRKAVDSGMSLIVQFDQLARDLGVYDRVERIPVFKELDRTVFDGSDPRAIQSTSESWNFAENKPNVVSKYSLDYRNAAYWPDRANNMRHRVVNTIEYLTDDPTYIWTDTAYYQHSDLINFAEPDRAWNRYEYKINGLAPGDEFIFGNPSNVTSFGNSRARQNDFLAVPFDAIKAGKIITAQPEKYYKGLDLVDNPYKNYAHSIAIEPGDVLNGTPVGGKIFVSISETFWDYTPEERVIDLYTDYWVDLIYNLGGFGLKQSEGGNGEAEAERARLKAKPYFRPIIPEYSAEYNAHRTYWSSNGEFLFTSYEGGDPTGIRLGAFFGIGAERTNKIAKARRQLLGLERVRDSLGRFASGSGGNGTLFFQIKTARVADTANVYVPNLLTRGIMWLSDRITVSGKVNRVVAMTADARLQPSSAVVDKDVSINATSMLSNAILPTNITGTITKIVASVTLTTLPLTAIAFMPVLGKQILPEKATATARIPEPGIFTYSAEDVILKIENYEPILYIRGDKIT